MTPKLFILTAVTRWRQTHKQCITLCSVLLIMTILIHFANAVNNSIVVFWSAECIIVLRALWTICICPYILLIHPCNNVHQPMLLAASTDSWITDLTRPYFCTFNYEYYHYSIIQNNADYCHTYRLGVKTERQNSHCTECT